mmetsp:Transcript_9806/g.39725  ORF Transcript_9806/g.39725 Transcript_9806/m.39725 type:complete len:222 (-) Transcript_9806:2-667(-)
MRRCEVIEKPRLLPGSRGAHADAEDPPAAPVVRLLEGEVSEQRPQAALEKVNVMQRTRPHQVLDRREKVPAAEEGHVREEIPEVLLAEELVQLLGGSAGDDRGDDAAHAAPRQHPRQQPPRVQRPGDAHVERPQRPSARQEQRGPPEAVPRLLQERQLLLDGHVVVLRDGPQLRASLVDVVSHRSRHPPQRLVQLAPDVRHVPEVPQDVRAEAEHHLLDVT